MGFYCRYVWHYATHAAHLTALLKLNVVIWSTKASQTFTKLKELITTTPVLALPDFNAIFKLENDASSIVIGVILS